MSLIFMAPTIPGCVPTFVICSAVAMAVVVDRKTKLTYEDHLQFPEDGRRHEIIDGDHYVTAAPSMYHQWILTRLVVQLYHHICEPGLGFLAPAPIDVVLTEADIVQPDIVVTLGQDDAVVRRERIDGAPDLVVEILSPSTANRDRGLKLDLYQKAAVSEYWIVDPERKVVQQYVLTDGVFRSTGEHADCIAVACTSQPDAQPVEINLTEVW
jgi:Uma2 family endonuclease